MLETHVLLCQLMLVLKLVCSPVITSLMMTWRKTESKLQEERFIGHRHLLKQQLIQARKTFMYRDLSEYFQADSQFQRPLETLRPSVLDMEEIQM